MIWRGNHQKKKKKKEAIFSWIWSNLPTGSCLICSLVKHIGDKNNLLEFICGAVISVAVANADFTAIVGDVAEFTIFGLLFIGSGLTLAVGISVKSGNVSHDDVCVCGCWFLNEAKLHDIAFPVGFSFLLSFVEASLDESPDDEASEPLSLEFSLFLH